jgi:hypothetical protein
VEELGARSGTEGVQALPESVLEFIGSYQVSAFAACSAMGWTACSRIWRSLRPREGVGSTHPLPFLCLAVLECVWTLSALAGVVARAAI